MAAPHLSASGHASLFVLRTCGSLIKLNEGCDLISNRLRSGIVPRHPLAIRPLWTLCDHAAAQARPPCIDYTHSPAVWRIRAVAAPGNCTLQLEHCDQLIHLVSEGGNAASDCSFCQVDAFLCAATCFRFRGSTSVSYNAVPPQKERRFVCSKKEVTTA